LFVFFKVYLGWVYTVYECYIFLLNLLLQHCSKTLLDSYDFLFKVCFVWYKCNCFCTLLLFIWNIFSHP
jgi:hypothetical protein